MSYVAMWVLALLLTLAIEVPLVVVLTGSPLGDFQGSQSAMPRRKVACFAAAAQLMTHPAVWFLFPLIPWMSRGTSFALSELWAWTAEATLYALTAVAPSTLSAVAISALANGASLAIGFLVF